MKRALLLASALIALPALVSPALAAPAESETVHVVASGETLNGIANRAGVSATAIVKANALKEPYVVRIGQKLTIPRAQSAVAAKPAPSKTDQDRKAVTRTANSAAPAAKQVAGAARVIEARTPSAPGAPEYETEHLVAEGETLGGIAARAKVPRVLIAEANGLQPPFNVRVGQTLKIPRTGRHVVKPGETGFSISMDTAVPWENIALANNLDPAAPVRAGQNLLIPTLIDPPANGPKTLAPAPKPTAAPSSAQKTARFAWPLSGKVRRGYSDGADYHDGIDIPAAKGTMVRAAAAGTVKFAGMEKAQFGNLVVLDHGDGWYTAYGFLSRVTVKEGATVAAGERVGLVGDTGLAKGDELHFEVRRDGQPVDPLGELPKAP